MAQVEVLASSLEKPELDDRSYRVIRLPNKMEALLASDPETDKASASVNVKVGSFSDADDMPGMAHAVEHLLFMGTKKYPVENAYSQYLSSHSGYSNAYTAPMETNYFFEIAASAEKAAEGATGTSSESPLRGALDRFAQFFISPLFLAETLNRELKAVDSENKKNLQSDTWRLSQLDKALSNPKHPYHHFSTGNLTSLRDEPLARGIDLRQAFIDFHASHYSANRAKLVVVGRESLDELQSWVVELFSDVVNKDLPLNTWPGLQPYSEDTLLKQIFAKPVMEMRSLEISFLYRNEDTLYETHPSQYLGHMIGHEGPGGILAYIKAKGWANALSAGANSICPDSGIFTVSVRLTPDGLEHYREVTEVVFQYISLIKEAGPQEWVVDELQRMGAVDFRFMQKTPASKFSSRLSSTMQKPLPREWLLSGTRLIRRYDSKALSDAHDLLRADNFRLTLVSRDYPGDWNQKEKWYGTEYKIEDIPADFVDMVRRAISSSSSERPTELHLPHRNEFIPARLTVDKKENVEPTVSPKLIRKDKSLRVWWKKDDQFWVPKASFIVGLRNPVVAITPANHVKARLFCQLVDDSLAEYAYDAEISGLGYTLEASERGLVLDVCGYNDKMPVLLEKVLRSMRELVVNPERFQIMKEKLSRAYRNWEYQQPFHQVGEFTRWLNNPSGWITDQYLAEMEYITEEDVQAFIPQLLNQAHIEVFAHGNLHKEDALVMTNLVESIIKPRPLPETQWNLNRNLILPEGSDYTFQRTLGDPANINNCIEYYLFVSPLDDKELRAKTLLLGQLGDERGFDTLRTKEQLGYIVFTGLRTLSSTSGYRVIIQSERTPEYLEERINAFLMSLGESIRDMSESDFEGHKRSVVNKRLEKLKNLDEEFSRFWRHVSSNYFDFKRHEIDAANIRSLTRQQMVEFFDRYIHPQSPHRIKLSVHLKAQGTASDAVAQLSNEEQSDKVTDMLSKLFNTYNIETDRSTLLKHVRGLSFPSVKENDICEMISKYLSEDVKAAKEQIATIWEQGQKVLGTALSSLGIELRGESGESELVPAPKVKETTYITDVPEFKSHMQLSAAPTPVVDLSTFEELESKL